MEDLHHDPPDEQSTQIVAPHEAQLKSFEEEIAVNLELHLMRTEDILSQVSKQGASRVPEPANPWYTSESDNSDLDSRAQPDPQNDLSPCPTEEFHVSTVVCPAAEDVHDA